MNCQKILPPIALQPYLRYFGELENTENLSAPKTFKIIVDGCPGLIFQENAGAFLGKNDEVLPQLFLHGTATAHSRKTAVGNYKNLVAYFRPNALKAIFGIDADALTDGYLGLNDLMKTNLAEQLLNANSFNEKTKILSDFLSFQLNKNRHRENSKTAVALAKINCENGESLQKIQRDLMISERGLERIFKSDIGISPKLFFRICRFQASLDEVRAKGFYTFGAVAHQHSYADQSHFIREFQAFAGCNPKQFLKNAKETALNFPEWEA